MIVLDENVIASQREELISRGLSVRQIGLHLDRKGLKDDNVIPVLHRLKRPTFVTRDTDFFDQLLCHAEYCLVILDVNETRVAEFVRRILTHPALDTQRKRMGKVIRAGDLGLRILTRNAKAERIEPWPK